MKTLTCAFLLLFAMTAAVVGQNFTVTIEEVTTGPNHTDPAIYGREVFYMSNGNLAHEVVKGYPTPHLSRVVNNRNGDTVVLYQSTLGNLSVKSTFNNPLPIWVLPTPESNCLKMSDGSVAPHEAHAMESIQGIPAMKTVDLVDGYSVTAWRAPSLGCVVVEQVVEFPVGGKSTKRLILVDRSTPSDSIFNPVAKEMKPSETRRTFMEWASKLAGQPCTTCSAAAADQRDALWLKQHGK
jgi:hypothetical protein